MHPYTELPGLSELILEESYVLHVEATPAQLVFSMELALSDKHPDYQPPGPDSYLCYRRGTLILSGVSRLLWEDQGAKPSYDATGEVDHGTIDYLRFEDGRYEVGGDVGQLVVVADRIDVALLPDAPD